MNKYQEYLLKEYEGYVNYVERENEKETYYHDIEPLKPYTFEEWVKMNKKHKRKIKYIKKWGMIK